MHSEKTLYVVTSHHDTEEKQKVLENLLNKLISIKSPEDQIRLVMWEHFGNISWYDKSDQIELVLVDNPILRYPERGFMHYQVVGHFHKPVKFTTIFPDTGWAVFNQIKKSASKDVSQFEWVYVINYDTNVTSELIEYCKNNNSNVICTSENENGTQYTPCLIFSKFKRDDFIEITNAINLKEYKRHAIPEDYWEHILNDFRAKLYANPVKDFIHVNNVSRFDNEIWSGSHDKFKYFIQNVNTLIIAAFDVTHPVDFKITCRSFSDNKTFTFDTAEILDTEIPIANIRGITYEVDGEVVDIFSETFNLDKLKIIDE